MSRTSNNLARVRTTYKSTSSSDALTRVKRATADAWRQRPRTSPADWVPNRVRLNDDYEATLGPYDLTSRPWWRAFFEAAGQSTTRAVRLRCSTQVGKTLSLCALILYLAENAPATGLAILPDRDAAAEFRDRLYALASRSGVRIPPAHRWNLRHVEVGDMRVLLAWPRSRQRLRGSRCKYVFRSEIDVWQWPDGIGDALEASARRTKAFSRSLIVDESTPIPETSRIERLERDTRQLRWHCCCPHCGAYQVPRFFLHEGDELHGRGGVDGIYDEHRQLVPHDVARRVAFYRCVSGCVITNDDKSRFMREGVVAAVGQTVTSDGAVVGEPLVSDPRAIGLHLWAIHSDDSFGDIAAEYVVAKRDNRLPDFFQNVLGKSHRTEQRVAVWHEVGTRLAGRHARGTIPSDAWFVTAGGDVQDREVYVTVRAWGDAKTSWLVDWFVFQRQANDDSELVKSDLKQIDAAVLAKMWPVVDANGNPASTPRGRSTLSVLRLGIDANHRTLDVHNWIKSLPDVAQQRVIAVRGDDNIDPAKGYKLTTVYESKRPNAAGEKTRYEGGLELLNLSPDVFRNDVAERFHGEPNRPGAWYVTRDTLSGGGQFYLRQLVNEPKVVVRGKDGRPRVEWKEQDTTIGHDFWDCEVYADAVAQYVVDEMPGQPGWNAAKWPNARTSNTSPDTSSATLVARPYS